VDTLLLIKAAIMGIVEGLTEFLPVSSTGHLILTEGLLKPGVDENVMHAFEVAIQPVEKTLTDEDFDALGRRIVDNVAKQTGGVLRS